jgi:hypothetical protein
LKQLIRQEVIVGKVKVGSFSLSLDGFGAGCVLQERSHRMEQKGQVEAKLKSLGSGFQTCSKVIDGRNRNGFYKRSPADTTKLARTGANLRFIGTEPPDKTLKRGCFKTDHVIHP